MDWTRARAILLVAFTVVNLVLAYSLWAPDYKIPALAEPSNRVQIEQLRARLAERGLVLPVGVSLPRTPGPMRFLRVEHRANLTFSHLQAELSRGGASFANSQRGRREEAGVSPELTLDTETRAVIYRPMAAGAAAREVDLNNQEQVRDVAEEYLRSQQLMPADAHLSGIFPREGGKLVEFVPLYQTYPVYSGYTRAYLTGRGIEQVVQFWVEPLGYKSAPPKAVRPAAEALLRLAGHLEQTGMGIRTITDVRLGYYSGPSVTVLVPEGVSAWDTVPVWRITLDNGLVYYINAFNGELES
ncbi:MAG: hypothetical protein ACOY93_12820 [Bacillota bacterium]